MGPHLGKLVNMHTLNLASTRCEVLRRWLLLVFDLLWNVCSCGADNDIGAEGAAAMGEHLGKLVNMHTLNLACTRCDVLRQWLLLVFDLLWYVCMVRGRQ